MNFSKLNSQIGIYETKKFIVFQWIADTLGINQLLPSNQFISDMGGTLCNDEHPNSQNVCSNMLFAIAGYDEEQTNKVPTYISDS